MSRCRLHHNTATIALTPAQGGIKVFSISPYKRMENLMVLEVNPEHLTKNLEKVHICGAKIPVASAVIPIPQVLFKSPNCVSVGASLALKVGCAPSRPRATCFRISRNTVSFMAGN